MPYRPVPLIHDWTWRAEPEELAEWMDEPCAYEEWRACVRDLRSVNRLTRGYRPTLGFLKHLLSKQRGVTRLRILDVGFGGGDALHRILRWSRAKKIAVELTGIDLNPFAARVAQERYAGEPIEWLTGDVFHFDRDVDVVISSLLAHHLATPEIVRLLAWTEGKAQLGWFINDLERSARSAKLFGLLAKAMRWHPFVRHDGPVSFARAFVADDWRRMLAAAGVPADSASVIPSFPSRLCVSRFR